MPQETPGRTTPAKAFIVLGLCLAVLGGVGAWLLIGREAAEPCNGLAGDERVQKSAGAAVRPGTSCAALAEAIVKASAGEAPGRHTQAQAQAQALKDVLVALGSGEPAELTLDPALRVPLATALADYAPDLHEMLGGIGTTDFLAKAAPQAPPWQSDGTHHLTVFADTLRGVVRAVAQDPEAYALLRMTETRTTAQRLAAVPADATDYGLSVPPTESARALGILDGISDAVTHGKDKGQARAWRTVVMDTLLDGPASPKSEQDPQASHLTMAWLQNLQNASEEERFDRLRAQGVDMARTWARERRMDEQTQQGLLAKVERSALGAYREIKS
ncbi:hypothetical protein Snoj_82810 [Streptomyces nojiriensis]|uniref:Uncharacterized protein n=1 Tax=Streptomyces nojiriensis TaxID=66374 RepID=A0ABQ3T1V0_9ACTN|nr:hypothetical protein [Streptomyces nojiriensis]QTI47853.1 hypothetical protein JYK04_05704 [Streptomyces nojiriensis]GGS15269.1 hypothetical protein GCM10010205_51450 [Streptomyces nojiriensis]GHI74363.1 hypothetical protein Snoj_82810 [Streptomyces nojiriensis]